MPINNHITADTVNHSFELGLSSDALCPKRLDSDSLAILVGLRSACARARTVLCEAYMGDGFDSSTALVALENINNALIAVNQSFDFDLSDDSSIEALIGLRNACVTAHRVLYGACHGGQFDGDEAVVAIGSINNALVRASFLS